jgi:outer membrane protein assembly factor BamB
VTLAHRIALALLAASALVLAGCGAGERIRDLNPFGGPETDDPNAPAESERISIMEFEERLNRGESFGAPVAVPRAYVNDRWPQPDGYATHAMQHTQASGDLEVLWRQRVGAGSGRDHRLTARPVLAEGVIYAIDGAGRVTARDAETGEELWNRRLITGEDREGGGWVPFIGGGERILTFGGGLAVDAGRLIAHAGGETLYALDAETGEELWRQSALTPFHSAPTAVEGRVFVSTNDNELLALDADGGEVLWTHRGIAETARLLTAASPAVRGEVVIAPYSSGEIVALRVQNGTVLWSDSLTRAGGLTPMSTINDIAASPVIIDDQVFAMSHSGQMAGFDIRTGERIWSQPAGGLHAPWVAGDFLFFVTTEAEVVAMERDTGAVRWITELASFRDADRRKHRIAWAGPILAGGRLVLANSRGTMMILDPATGERIGSRDLGDNVYIAPIIAGETVYFLTDEARLIALR